MADLLNVFFKLHNLLILHAIHNKHGERTRPKVFHHDILTFHRLNILWQIGKDIIIYPGIHIPQYRRNQQQYADDQDRRSVLHHFFPKLNHTHLLLFFF